MKNGLRNLTCKYKGGYGIRGENIWFRSRSQFPCTAREDWAKRKRERERKKLSKSKNKIWRSPNSIASKRQSSINKQMVETSIARLGEEEGIPTRPKFSIAFLATVPHIRTSYHVPRFLRGKKSIPRFLWAEKAKQTLIDHNMCLKMIPELVSKMKPRNVLRENHGQLWRASNEMDGVLFRFAFSFSSEASSPISFRAKRFSNRYLNDH